MNQSFVVLILCQWWLGIALAVGGAYRQGLLVKFLTRRPCPDKDAKTRPLMHFKMVFAWMVVTLTVSALKVPIVPVLTTYMWMKNLFNAYSAVAYGESDVSDSVAR